jgi:hypothetical protein
MNVIAHIKERIASREWRFAETVANILGLGLRMGR